MSSDFDTSADLDVFLLQNRWTRFFSDDIEREFVRFRHGGPTGTIAGIGTITLIVFIEAVSRPTTLTLTILAITVASAVVVGALLVATAVYGRRSAVHALTAAHRMEQLSIATAIVIGALSAGASPQRGKEKCDHSYAGDPHCQFSVDSAVTAMAIASILLAPRLPFAAGVNGFIVVVAIVADIFGSTHYTAVDYTIAVLLYVAWAAALTLVAHGTETTARSHFAHVLALHHAEATLVTSNVNVEIILGASLPAQLLDPTVVRLADMTHESGDATVGITDIHGFAQWSTGVLIVTVVKVLHGLLTLSDMGLREHRDVERVVTYGDSYVVCANLLSPVTDHAVAVLEFAKWQSQRLCAFADHLESPFALRQSVCTGALCGGVAGRSSLHYVLAGNAMDQAERELLLCDAGQRSVPSPQGSVLAAGGGAGQQRDGEVPAWRRSAPPGVLQSENPYGLSIWLTFHSAVAQQLMCDVTTQNDAVARTTAAVPAIVVTAYVAVLSIEFASDDPRRHHDRAVMPFTLLIVALVLFYFNLGARLRATPLPVALTTVAVVSAFLATGVALVFVDCVFVKPKLGYIIMAGLPHARRLPLVAQIILLAIMGVLPVSYYRLVTSPYDSHGAGSVIVVIAVSLAMFAFRYVTVKAEATSIQARLVAATAVVDSTQRVGEQSAMLVGLIPPHALAFVPRSFVADLPDPTFHQMFDGLSVLQLQLAFDFLQPDASAMENINAVWCDVAATLDAVADGLLEVVQTSGDRFLVAGPFEHERSDVLSHRAAQLVVTLLRQFAQVWSGRCGFTAVATAGSAFSTLLGASLLSFRLFGAAVRESDALLAAAPRPVDDKHCCVAFAADSFCRQERNFERPAQRVVGDASMSQAVLPEADKPSPTSDANCTESTAFGDASQWRARGVGSAAVRCIRL
jgi:class 3 adenylate cyclase